MHQVGRRTIPTVGKAIGDARGNGRDKHSGIFLLLGGAGQTGMAIARFLIAQRLARKIVIASLGTEAEESATTLRQEIARQDAENRQDDSQDLSDVPDISVESAQGNVFVRTAFAGMPMSELMAADKYRLSMYEDVYGPLDAAYERSYLVKLYRTYAPEVVVDCINTATAISYMDAYTATSQAWGALSQYTRRARQNPTEASDPNGGIEQVRATRPLANNEPDGEQRASNAEKAFSSTSFASTDEEATDTADILSLLEEPLEQMILAQALPQLVRHMLIQHRALVEVGARLYLKLGTTGTGGMGLNIPYTHSEDKPSAQLLTKTSVAFAQSGLLFLMARTPGGPIVKEIKPAALVGYAGIETRPMRNKRTARGARGSTDTGGKGSPEPLYKYEPRLEAIPPPGERLVLRDEPQEYRIFEQIRLAVANTGENGFFTRGEFETITALGQMEFLTPEEIAEKVILEVRGANTGLDVIAALDGAVMDPTYRAGYIREYALAELKRQETESGTPSVALGELGPPELSKLLWEAELLRRRYDTISRLLEHDPVDVSSNLTEFITAEDGAELRRVITSTGLPVLLADGLRLLRGPRISIPESVDDVVPTSVRDIETWVDKGWVDLRPSNIERWQTWFRKMVALDASHLRGTGAMGDHVDEIGVMQQPPQVRRAHSSAAFNYRTYTGDTIRIGEVVAWVFNNVKHGYRVK
ncbi:MAG: hypothetical protein M3437_01685 [Chloroflexota bacterium]|nr:hypothetical protein [Chloroflexota bacterium]MDQ5867155.1 hypothetical protein [Chloroflexota bacterium]